MNSDGFTSIRCYQIVDVLVDFLDFGKEISSRNIRHEDITQLKFSCLTEAKTEVSDKLEEPMVWIGIYIAVASFLCILAMAADLFHGFRNKKFWIPCKYFTLNAASITVITITMKLPVDLSAEMTSYMDQAAKFGSLGFMCTMMANVMPSLASMDNKTLLANLIGLSILVITTIVNVIITVIGNSSFRERLYNTYFEDYYLSYYAFVAYVYIVLIILLLVITISSSLTISISKEILDSKYQATNKIFVTDQSLQHANMSTVERLRQHVRRYWVMSKTSSPQFVMTSNQLSTASGVISVLSLLMTLGMVLSSPLVKSGWREDIILYCQSPYKWSTALIFITHFIGVVVGTIAPVLRCFSVFRFKGVTKWNKNQFIFLEVEKYWTQKLYQWKESPLQFLSNNPRSRSFVYSSKNVILSYCIRFQKVTVVSCKLIWLIATIIPICVVSCLYHLKLSIDASRTDDLDEDLINCVLKIDNKMDLGETTLKGILKSLDSFILKAVKEQNNKLLDLLKKSTGFKGVEIFDTDHVQPLLPVELVNTWSLPIVTLTYVAIALPSIPKHITKRLLKSVCEGLSYTHLVEESLNSASDYVNTRNATLILWHEVDQNFKWLNNPLGKIVFKRKTTTEIVEWFSDKAKEIVIETCKKNIDGELMDNPSHQLIAANSMYRITQTILLRFQSNIEPMTKEQLFAHLTGMIADIFYACFTNIPRVITIKCHESVIEKREASVEVAAKLFGRTTKIIELLEACDQVPKMDDEKMGYIDEWRLYLKQSIL